MSVLAFQTIKEVFLTFKAAGPGDLIFFPEESEGKLLNALNDVRVLHEPGRRNERSLQPTP